VSFDGAEGDYLIKDPNDENRSIVWIPGRTRVAVLDQAKGCTSYGSGVWNLVSLINPETKQLTEGWLPSEAVDPVSPKEKSLTQQENHNE
jgi:hypothetical protein